MQPDANAQLMIQPSRARQWVADQALRRQGPVARRLFAYLRDTLTARRDGAVRHMVADHQVLLPLSHRLPDYRARWPWYDTALPHLAATLARRSGGNLVAIDIGANVGDTAVPLL